MKTYIYLKALKVKTDAQNFSIYMFFSVVNAGNLE